MSIQMKARGLVRAVAIAAVALATVAGVSAQQAPPAQPPATPYKPDFVIPKPDGPNGPPAGQQAPSSPAPDQYVIGPQDNLSINVVDEMDLTGKYRVDNDGSLTFPYLGRLSVAGMSLNDLQAKLTMLLRQGYIKNPQVRVEVDQYKSRNIYVIGEVRAPGKITMSGTSMTLLEALALAGSPTSNASNEIFVVHPSKRSADGTVPAANTQGERLTVNRKDLELGRAGQDIVLQDGDIINVPVAQKFYISGFIRNPGTFVLDPGMTVQQAIALAGGMTERGSDRRMTVKRLVDGKLTEIQIKMEDKVQANDTIEIPARFF